MFDAPMRNIINHKMGNQVITSEKARRKNDDLDPRVLFVYTRKNIRQGTPL